MSLSEDRRTNDDPIASATLAQLYVAQGHRRKALQTLAMVLRRDPTDGHALHLTERLRVETEASLKLTFEDGLELAWQGAPRSSHAILLCIRIQGGVLDRVVTSVACAHENGRHRFTPPFPRGSVAACVGTVVPGHGFVVHAVARSIRFET